MTSEMQKATWKDVIEHMKRSAPEIDLDQAGAIVERTPEGLLVRFDPVQQVKAARKAGLLVAAFFGMFAAFIPSIWARLGFGALALAAVVLGFRAKPRDDRLLVSPAAVRVAVKGKPPREVPASSVKHVLLERHEYETGGKNRTTVVEWPVRFELADGERWLVLKGQDRGKCRQFAEDASIALGVPFVDATAFVPASLPLVLGRATPPSTPAVVLSPDHVNLPLLERLRTRVLDPPDAGPVPKGVEVREVARGVEFSHRHRHWGAAVGFGVLGAWFTFLGGLMTAAALATAITDESARWLALVALFPFAFFCAGLALLWGASRHVTGETFVRVTKDGVVHGTRRGGKERPSELRVDDYEDVRAMRGVVFLGDEKETNIGFGGLPAEAQQWVATSVLRALQRYA